MSLSKRETFDQPLRNVGSEEIPPFAVVEVKSPGFQKTKGKEWFPVGKPSGNGKVYFINGPFPIPPNGPGGGAAPFKTPGVHALFDPALSPTTNQTLGPIAGKWHLGTGSGFIVHGDILGSPASQPGFPAAASTRRVRVTVETVPGQLTVEGILIADVPAATIAVSESSATVTPGYADAAVIPLEWTKPSVQDSLTGDKDDNGALVKLPALNIKWPHVIKAAADQYGAVLVSGTRENRGVYSAGNPTEKEVFVIRDMIYPVQIVAGRVSSSVAGGDWVQSVEKVLWGRPVNPANAIGVKNPDSWTGPPQGYAVAVRLPDGTWHGLDLECV